MELKYKIMDVEYQLIKKSDDFCSNEEQLISLLKSNKYYNINIKDQIITYKNVLINYSIKKCETVNKDNTVFIVKFTTNNQNNLDTFEKFDKSFLDFIKRFVSDISLNILHDDISKYYANNMYSQIFDIENLLRKIIYCFMGRNVGKDWIQKCFPKDVTASIKEVYKKSENEYNENILYSVDFIQLEKLLFIKYPLKYIKQEQFINSLKEIEEEGKITEVISDYEYKSNWDRYFSEVVCKDKLDENLSELYKYRILVAHNKKIRKQDRDKTKKLIKNINEKLNECLSNIEKIEVPEEKKEALENMSTNILNYNNDSIYKNAYFIGTQLEKAIGISPAIKNAIQSSNLVSPNLHVTKNANLNSSIINFDTSNSINLEASELYRNYISNNFTIDNELNTIKPLSTSLNNSNFENKIKLNPELRSE